MISRAVVLLPQPVSPTMPERLAALDVEADAVDRLHRADLALEDDPARDREVLDEVAHLHERLAGAGARAAAPVRQRADASSCGLGGCVGARASLGRPPPRAPARACARAQLAPTAAAHVGSSRQATWWLGLAGHRLELRVDARVVGLRVGAARVEVAARRAVDQARRRARDRHELLLARAVERRDRLQQAPRVGVLGAGEQQLGRGRLDDPPGVHHRDVVGHLGDHAEVVGDDHDRHPELALQAFEQREDLRLHGHVERRRRLVGDQQLRLVGERHRDHRALAHAAGELVRVLVDAPRAGRGCPTSPSSSTARSRACALETSLVGAHRLDQLRRRPCRTGAARTAGPGRSSRCRCRGSRAARSSDSVTRSRPSNRMRPEMCAPWLRVSPSVVSEATVLPEPDSPTIPSVRPRCTS